MKANTIISLVVLFIVSALVFSSCVMPGATPQPTETPAFTNTPEATATSTPKPTHTPLPTPTPNLAATQQVETFNALVKEYYDAGYIKTTDGTYTHLDDASHSWAEGQYYRWWEMDLSATDFILKSDIAWKSASASTNAVSGCGFVFNMQGSGDEVTHYVTFISVGGYVYYWSEMRQLGQVYYGTGKKTGSATMTLLIADDVLRVFVNSKLLKTFGVKGTGGDLAYTVISGTNKDYGTKCEFTNTELWKFEQ